MLNGLDLFSGIGGLAVALRQYVRPIAYCEIDTYCQGVLLSNMVSKRIFVAPIWDDVKTLSRDNLPNCVDIIYGGFPCQDISIAGHGKGLAGERSGLYWQIHRLAKEIQPKFIFLENVPAILCRGGSAVVESLAEMGYDCRWCVISAASVGALHRRERWFLLAHSKRDGRRPDAARHELQAEPAQLQRQNGQTCADNPETICPDVADASITRLEGQRDGAGSPSTKESMLASGSEDVPNSKGSNDRQFTCQQMQRQVSESGKKTESGGIIYDACEDVEQWREVVSSVCRTTDGVPCRMERIKSLGNAVVPLQAKTAFETLMGLG
jgi:DNA (cytosine-5)-methyltransferase 1